MKKAVFILMLITVLFLVACSQEKTVQQSRVEKQPEVTVDEETVVTEDKTTTTTEEIPPAPTPGTPQFEEGLSKELQELLTKADKSVSSFKYLAYDHKAKNFLNTYFIKGSKIKVKLFQSDYYPNIAEYFDTVYLDTSTKSAVGRCEDKQRCISKDIDNTKKEFSIEYHDYMPENTPYTWVKKVKKAEIVGPELYENKRQTTKIRYTEPDGRLVQMWIDVRYGLALKVIVEKNGQEVLYKYADIDVNSLKDPDVTAPKLAT